MGFELRKWRTEDYIEFYQYTRSESLRIYMSDSFPSTVGQCRNLLEKYCKSEIRQCARAIIVNGRIAGFIGIVIGDDIYCRCAELTFWLGEGYWGKGIMVVVIRQFCFEIFRNYQVVRIFARPLAHHQHPRMILAKAGFTMEGVMRKCVYKQERYFDCCMYALYK